MRIKNVPFNINAGVKVRLTEEAKLYLEKDLAKYGAKLKRAVILSFAMSSSYLVKDMEELLKEYECDNELTEERLNKMREGIQHYKIFEIELKEVLREGE
ncbi:MAG: hypothetical protein E6343_16250 [Clostridium perfringens]|nr:hypothetical protein [Clostridium perfringens]